jgi:hypothetical protein
VDKGNSFGCLGTPRLACTSKVVVTQRKQWKRHLLEELIDGDMAVGFMGALYVTTAGDTQSRTTSYKTN